MAINWSEDLSVGVEEIDRQHQEMFKAVDSMVEAMSKGGGEELIEDLINFLGNYVQDHFAAEESYMTRYGYQDYEAHKAEHDRFIASFGEFKEKHQHRDADALSVIRAQRWLYEWLRNHIKSSDKAFGQWLKTRI